MADIARQITYTGRVQGVGFRFTAQRIAMRYELTGYVKNLPTGQVEMLIQGHPEDIEDCIRDLSETFSVRDTKIEQAPLNARYTSFEIAF